MSPKNTNSYMISRVEVLEKKSCEKNVIIQKLEERIEYLERNLNSPAIEIRNLPKKDKETTDDLKNILQATCKALNIELQAFEPKEIYRTENKTNDGPIIVRFSSSITKNQVLSEVKKYNKRNPGKKFNASLIGATNQMPVYISELLNQKTKKLFFISRKFAKENGIKYCWTANGKIFMRKTDGTRYVTIKMEEDLNLKSFNSEQ